MKGYIYTYKLFKKLYRKTYLQFIKLPVWFKLKVNNVKVGKEFTCLGIPIIDVWDTGEFYIGDNVMINNGRKFNVIGRQQPCYFVVYNGGVLKIGNNVGISATAIVCTKSVTIGNNVMIGGNVVIYDTDFHSVNKAMRTNWAAKQSGDVVIENDVFIGAHSTILKGVTIGEGAVIGAGSVVAKSIPKNEIWAGNPARFIKNVDN